MKEFERIDEMKMFINNGIHRIHGMMVSIAVLFGIVGLSHAGGGGGDIAGIWSFAQAMVR